MTILAWKRSRDVSGKKKAKLAATRESDESTTIGRPLEVQAPSINQPEVDDDSVRNEVSPPARTLPNTPKTNCWSAASIPTGV